MGDEGLRARPRPGGSTPPPDTTAAAIGAVGVLAAAALGAVGSVGTILGWGPVTLSADLRGAALLTVAAVAVAAATLAGRAPRPLRPATATGLAAGALVLGALATWPTTGRVQGLWCAAAAGGAAAVLRAASRSATVPARVLAALPGAVGIAAAGLWWSGVGPGPLPAAALVASVGAGVAVAHDARFAVAAERRATVAVAATRTAARRAERAWARVSVRTSMAVAAVVGVALTAPIFHRLASSDAVRVTGFNDYRSHLDLAAQLRWDGPRLTVPHPMFHVPVRLLGNVVDEPLATTVVLCGAVAVAVASLTWIGTLPFAGRPGLPARTAPLFALGFLVAESPTAVLQAAGLLGEDSRYAAVHMWASPTEVMLLPFVFLLVVKVAEQLEHAAPDRRLVLTTAALASGAALTKPSLTLALVPAVVVLVALGRSAGARSSRALLGSVVAPSALIVAWQTWFLEVGNLPQGRSAFALRPGETLRTLRLGGDDLWFWTALAVVAGACWIGGRAFFRDRTVQVTLASLACGAAVLALFYEGGVRRLDGNLAKPAYFAWLLLFTWSFRLLVLVVLGRRTGDDPAPADGDDPPAPPLRRGRVAVAAALLAAVLVGGAVAWADAVGAVRVPGWETAW